MKQRLIRILGVFVIVIVAAAVFEIARYRQATNTASLPTTIKQKLAMPALTPVSQADNYTLNQDSIKYDDKEKLLSYTLASSDNSITVTEQPYPDVLIYDKLTGAIGQYSQVDTTAGKVTLGRPKDGGGAQVAVLNYNNQTLIFAKPQKDLSDDQWRLVFNTLEVVK